jgi:sugar lactone lactonase YvrE
MFSKTSRAVPILALLVVVAAGAGYWLLSMLGWLQPAPTDFGWQAALTTVAGDGVRGQTDGAGAAARFGDPFAVAMDEQGVLYVADAADRGHIRRINADGVVTTLPGSFDTPSGLAIDRKGNVIVAETGAHAIRMISPEGAVTTLGGTGTPGYRDGPASGAQFDGPIGVAVDVKGNVYVTDSYNDRIRLITPDGEVRTLAGQNRPGFADGQGAAAAFDTPTGIALDGDGAIVVADTGNDAIRKVTPDGVVSTLARTDPDDAAGLLRGAVGLAPTWDGFVYIASYQRGRIVQMSPQGALGVLAGQGATAPGNADLRLLGPSGIAVDRKGALYVADASAFAIRKLSRRTANTASDAVITETQAPALVRTRPFPWPFAPQYGSHEVVGVLGEVRGNYEGESRHHLHAGLDISKPMGTTVLAVARETVRDPLPNSRDIGGLNETLRTDQMTYVHMRVGRTLDDQPLDEARFKLIRNAEGQVVRVRVRRGTRFEVGDRIGTINRMAHVHLELGPPRDKLNALALPFPGLSDHVAPRIDDVHLLDSQGRRLDRKLDGHLLVLAQGGPLDIVAEAWDQVDGNAGRRRLGLYKAGFQILKADGTPVRGFERPRITLEFDRMPLASDAAKIVYAPASDDTVHSDQRTRMLYVVSNWARHGRTEKAGWNPADLPPGQYVIRILAADRMGNVAMSGRDLPVAIR